jgi:pyridoxamine 5'-phosphate oxidase
MRKLSRHCLFENPIDQFRKWQQDAFESGGHRLSPMFLSTAGADGLPSIRTVLLKGFSNEGFLFYSNYDSEKGRQIEENWSVSVLFYWENLERQVRICGNVKKLSAIESDKYFQSRPRDAQIGAVASPQSERIEDRAELEDRYKLVAKKFDGMLVQRPINWGGYRLVPVSLEFWQGRKDRLHDRFIYKLGANDTWSKERLAP